MGAVCPGCNKFYSKEQSDPEFEGGEISYVQGEKTANVKGSVRMVLTSACCSEEVAETTQEYDVDVDVVHDHPKDKGDIEFTLEEEGENTDRYEGRGRGQRHYYGVEVTLNLDCSCGWKTSAMTTVEEQASAFDEM